MTGQRSESGRDSYVDDLVQMQWPEGWSEIEQAQRQSAVTAEMNVDSGVDLHTEASEQEAGFMGGIEEKELAHSQLQQKLIHFMRQLEQWRLEARQGSLSELIWRIYRETGYLIGLAGFLVGSSVKVI